jgi:DNA-binding NarL/FixJ family response regulator
MQSILATMSNPVKSTPNPLTNTSITLSERELQVIELVAAGLTNQDIAIKLEISKRTVDNHISNILTKTKTDNRVALVRWALQWGKVCIDEVNCCILDTHPVTNVLSVNKLNQDLQQELESA